MNKKNESRWLLRCVIFTVSVCLITLIVMLLYAKNIIRDNTSLIMLFAIYVMSTFLFSPIKGTVDHPLIYNLSVLVIHIVCNIIMVLVMGYLYTGWETAMFFWTEVFSIIYLAIILLFDTILILVRK
jgi:hypothetical protein